VLTCGFESIRAFFGRCILIARCKLITKHLQLYLTEVMLRIYLWLCQISYMYVYRGADLNPHWELFDYLNLTT
jgi:hypothetical protein